MKQIKQFFLEGASPTLKRINLIIVYWNTFLQIITSLITNVIFLTLLNFCMKLMTWLSLKVVLRVENTEVFKKDWNFANRTYSVSCKMRKHYFPLLAKETAFFPYCTMKLFSTELSYLTLQSTLNFTWISLYF